jgi:hypothetical protein
MSKQERCKFCPGQGHWITHNRRPVFFHDGACKSDLPSLVRSSYRGSYGSFTRSINCRDCGRPCFIYHNSDTDVWVIFDSLGPPWPKHSCADKEAPSPLDWQNEGFNPIHILDAIADAKHQALTLQIELMPAGEKLALKLQKNCDIPRMRSLMNHPFHVKQIDKNVWLLNTFEQIAGGSVWSKTFKCDKVGYQETLFST